MSISHVASDLDDILFGRAGSPIYGVCENFDDIINGFGGNDTIFGSIYECHINSSYPAWYYNSGNDTLSGNDGNDYLFGTGTLIGGSGDDTLYGSGLLQGGSGNDLYVCPSSAERNTIIEEDNNGTDTILFPSSPSSSFNFYHEANDLIMTRPENFYRKTTFKNWYLGNNYQVENFIFSDMTLNASAFTNLPIDTMQASFAVGNGDHNDLWMPMSVLFSVFRYEDTAIPVSIDYATSNGTGIAGTDYVSKNGTLNFAAGETIKYLNIDLIHDSPQGNVFYISLSNPSAGTRILNDRATGTYYHTHAASQTDTTPAIISVSGSSCNEGSGLHIVFSRAGNTSSTVTFNAATTDGTAINGQDYYGGNGSITFAAGVTSVSVDLQTIDDSLVEGNETFSVVLSNPSNDATLSTSSATMTILDNDTQAATGFYRIDTSIPSIGPILWANSSVASNFDLSLSTNYDSAIPNNNIVGLAGSSLNDILRGGSQNNQLWGGPGGNDTLAGGAGADTYWFGRNSGNTVIEYSHDNAGDIVYFFDSTWSDLTFSQAPMTNDLVARLGNAQLTIKNWCDANDTPNRIKLATFADGFWWR